jgi:hypothetical protein
VVPGEEEPALPVERDHFDRCLRSRERGDDPPGFRLEHVDHRVAALDRGGEHVVAADLDFAQMPGDRDEGSVAGQARRAEADPAREPGLPPAGEAGEVERPGLAVGCEGEDAQAVGRERDFAVQLRPRGEVADASAGVEDAHERLVPVGAEVHGAESVGRGDEPGALLQVLPRPLGLDAPFRVAHRHPHRRLADAPEGHEAGTRRRAAGKGRHRPPSGERAPAFSRHGIVEDDAVEAVARDHGRLPVRRHGEAVDLRLEGLPLPGLAARGVEDDHVASHGRVQDPAVGRPGEGPDPRRGRVARRPLPERGPGRDVEDDQLSAGLSGGEPAPVGREREALGPGPERRHRASVAAVEQVQAEIVPARREESAVGREREGPDAPDPGPEVGDEAPCAVAEAQIPELGCGAFHDGEARAVAVRGDALGGVPEIDAVDVGEGVGVEDQDPERGGDRQTPARKQGEVIGSSRSDHVPADQAGGVLRRDDSWCRHDNFLSRCDLRRETARKKALQAILPPLFSPAREVHARHKAGLFVFRMEGSQGRISASHFATRCCAGSRNGRISLQANGLRQF